MNTSRLMKIAVVVVIGVIGSGFYRMTKPMNNCKNIAYFVAVNPSFTVEADTDIQLSAGIDGGNISFPRTITVDIPAGLIVDRKDQPECQTGNGCQIITTTGYDSDQPFRCTYLERFIGTISTNQPGNYTLNVTFTHQDPDNNSSSIFEDEFKVKLKVIEQSHSLSFPIN